MERKTTPSPMTLYTCTFCKYGDCKFDGKLPSAAREFRGKRYCRAAGSINESDVLERCDSAKVESTTIVAQVSSGGAIY